jgi:hypothetical protein
MIDHEKYLIKDIYIIQNYLKQFILLKNEFIYIFISISSDLARAIIFLHSNIKIKFKKDRKQKFFKR